MEDEVCPTNGDDCTLPIRVTVLILREAWFETEDEEHDYIYATKRGDVYDQNCHSYLG